MRINNELHALTIGLGLGFGLLLYCKKKKNWKKIFRVDDMLNCLDINYKYEI